MDAPTRAGEGSLAACVRLRTPKDALFSDFAIGTDVAISPRGDRIAFTAGRKGAPGVLNIRSLDELYARVLPTFVAARMPAFSPDGKWVAFADGNDVMKVSVDGGPVSKLASIPDGPAGISWGSRGTIVVGGLSTGLYVIPEGGGSPHLIPRAAGERGSLWPLILPDGQTVVFEVVFDASAASNTARLAVTSIAGGERNELGVHGTTPLGYLAGHLVYTTSAGTLMALPFDARTRHVRGAPIPIAEGVLVDPVGGAKAGLSASGTLIYRNGRTESRPVLVRRGSATDLLAEARDFSDPRYSPDGRRVAFTISSAQSIDVWVLEPGRGTLTRLTNEGTNRRPEWTPDGKRILFVSDRGGQVAIWWQAADGVAPAELLYSPA